MTSYHYLHQVVSKTINKWLHFSCYLQNKTLVHKNQHNCYVQIYTSVQLRVWYEHKRDKQSVGCSSSTYPTVAAGQKRSQQCQDGLWVGAWRRGFILIRHTAKRGLAKLYTTLARLTAFPCYIHKKYKIENITYLPLYS